MVLARREASKDARLVTLDGEQEMRAAPGQVGGVPAPGVHRISRDDRSGDVCAVQQEGEHRDLVRLRPHLHLAQDSTMSMIEGGQQVITGFPAAGRAA
jgi:hypothetical protein